MLGLAAAGVCPECAAPVADSLLPTAFGFLSDADAKRLHRGVKRLAGSLGCFLVGVLFCLGVLVGGLGGVILVMIGVLAMTVSTLFWISGWVAVAGVRAHGTTPPARLAVGVLRFAVWGQLGSVVVMVVDGQLGWTLVGGYMLVTPLTLMGFTVLTLAAGHGSLVALVRVSGPEGLRRDADVLSGLIAAFLGLSLIALVLLAAPPLLGTLVGLFALFLGLGVAVAWWGFLTSLDNILQVRLAGSGPGPRGTPHG